MSSRTRLARGPFRSCAAWQAGSVPASTHRASASLSLERTVLVSAWAQLKAQVQHCSPLETYLSHSWCGTPLSLARMCSRHLNPGQ